VARTGFHALTAIVDVLAAVALGLAAGALLVEAAVLIPSWRASPPEAFLRWYADNASRLFDFFGPLEIASAGLAAVAALLYRYQRGAAGGLFIVSAVLAVAVLAAFPLYFERVNASFAAGTIARDRVADELTRYAAWHWGRTAIGLLSFVSAVLGVRATKAPRHG
jgi:hypothetical protein